MKISKFSDEVKKALDHYVYVFKDEDGRITYVGKGCGDRVLNREQGDAYIIAYGMDEDQALSVEAMLIELLRSVKLPPKLRNICGGDKKAIKWMVGQFSVAEIEEQLRNTHYVLVLNVTKSYVDGKSLYEAVKGEWAPDPWKASHADYVLAEKKGKVIGVFKANAWHKCKGSDRYWFEGEEVTDPAILQECMKIRVARSRGEANPVRYIYLKPKS